MRSYRCHDLIGDGGEHHCGAGTGDPDTVILDEPVNGLYPEGVRWVRNLLKDLAAKGRTVFLSSHLMSEMALIAEHVIMVGKGHLIADVEVAELIASASANAVRVRSPEAAVCETFSRDPTSPSPARSRGC